MGISKKKVIGAIGGLVLGAAFILLFPDVGLGEQGVRCLGILIGAIVWWVCGVLPEYATGLIMVVLFAVIAGVGMTTSMSGFASETWWLLVGAFGLGAGMKLSGLMERMARAIVRTFPNTFAAQVAGLVAAGSLIGPLVPSLAAKVSILEPIALGMGEALGYERFGKPMQGLFLAVFTSVRSIALLAISASIVGYAFLATFPDDVKAHFDMAHWALAAVPWFIVATVLNYAAIVAIYRPRSTVSSDALGNTHDSEPATTPAESVSVKPSPMSRHEKQMCAIILTAVALWATQPLHGIGPHIVALTGFVCTIACGILGPRGMRESISWEALVFIGTAFGLSAVFAEAGIQDWLVAVASPAFEALVGNPYLFVLGIGLLTVAIRFVIVSEVAYLNITMPFLVPLALAAGISPWVVAFSMYACISPWFMIYQNSVYLPALYSVDGQMVRHGDVAKYCFVYLAICLIGLAASVPHWQLMGLM
jgi:DASS family divalent anion:Na+ symporter